MKDNLYVVYHVEHNGEVVYIGYGNQSRPAHATSGVSNNYQLNRLHHTGEILTTEIVYSTTDKEDAKKREKEDIIKWAPMYNSIYVVTARQEAAHRGVGARIKISNILNTLDKNKTSTTKIKDIFGTLLKMFTIPQLILGVNIRGIEAPHFNQLRRLSEGGIQSAQSNWYQEFLSTGLVEILRGPQQSCFLKIIID